MAFLCRYANQNLFQLLGRDPVTQPLSSREEALFISATRHLVEMENKKPEDAVD
jgi:hypothetical protein